jgi:hypothetical protein
MKGAPGFFRADSFAELPTLHSAALQQQPDKPHLPAKRGDSHVGGGLVAPFAQID